MRKGTAVIGAMAPVVAFLLANVLDESGAPLWASNIVQTVFLVLFLPGYLLPVFPASLLLPMLIWGTAGWILGALPDRD